MKNALIFCAAVAVAVLLAWASTVYNKPPLPPVGVSIQATPAPEVRDVPQVPVAVKAPVQVYKGGAALKKKLKLPTEVAENPAKEIIASSKAKADSHPQTITTVIDTETGKSETFIRRDPLPWLAWDTSGEIGMYAGIKNGHQAVRLQARQGIAQVKDLHFGIVGSVDQAVNGAAVANGTDYFVGIGAWAKW